MTNLPLLADLKAVHHLETTLEPKVQVAARMLWAAVDVQSCVNRSYSAFLASLLRDYPSVLARLDPFIILCFIHLSAGIPASSPSLVVFAWDEVNIVPATRDGAATFFQQQLSEVVSSRRTAMEGKGIVDVLLVPVAASTRGSAMNLSPTASKKAGYTDLRLPLIKSTDDMALLVADLMRRLRKQSDTTLSAPPVQPLSAMSREVRGVSRSFRVQAGKLMSGELTGMEPSHLNGPVAPM